VSAAMMVRPPQASRARTSSSSLVVGVVVATVRVAPGQEHAPASTLRKPEVDAPKQTRSLPSTGETLSERLDRTDGVIKPPACVDPGIHAALKDPTDGSNMQSSRHRAARAAIRAFSRNDANS
jgi:hypothetical protein